MRHKPYYRDVRGAIRRYPYYCERLAQMKASRSGEGVAVSSGMISKPTERLALITLPTERQEAEYNAVRKALAITRAMPTGEARLRLIRLKYWERERYDLEAAARAINYSHQQTWRFHVEFEQLVARFLNYGDCGL